MKDLNSLQDFLILGFFHPKFCFRLLLGLGLLPITGSEWCRDPGSFKAKASTFLEVELLVDVEFAAATLSELIERVDRGTRLDVRGRLEMLENETPCMFSTISSLLLLVKKLCKSGWVGSSWSFFLFLLRMAGNGFEEVEDILPPSDEIRPRAGRRPAILLISAPPKSLFVQHFIGLGCFSSGMEEYLHKSI